MSCTASRPLFVRLLIPAVALFAAALASLATPVFGAGQAAPASVRDGVFTDAQADRGKALYEEKCMDCHAARIWGPDWDTKTVADLYETVAEFMPENAPGSLSAEEARDSVAYILKANRFPAGARELPATVDGLKAIMLAPPTAP